MIALKALAVGFAFGMIVRKVGLPAPAPPTLVGVLAVVGVTLGFLAAGLR